MSWKKRHFLLPYFGSDMQGDLLKSSTFPKEVGHLVTLILVERPNLAVARLVSNFCLPEVVKSPLGSMRTLITQDILLSRVIEILISVAIK